MTCNCNNHPVSRRCACSRGDTPTPNKKAVVGFCDICDPCEENVSEARICAFVVPTLEEGRYFRNSFIFVQEDDSVYFITNERSEIPFGSRPKFIDGFDPEDPEIHFKNTVVYDLQGQAAYVYGPDGNYMTIPLTDNPVTDIVAGENILVTNDGGVYTIAVDMDGVASAEGLQTVTLLATNHTSQISALQTATTNLQSGLEELAETVGKVHDTADEADEKATLARAESAVAQQTASEAAAAVAGKQDTLSAGENITISNNVISASVPSYSTATRSQNGLMSSKDREVLNEQGIYVPADNIETTSNSMSLDIDKYVSDANGSSYTHTVDMLAIPMASTTKAGAMTAADKTKLDSLDSVNDATITITQGGVFKGSFTTNQGTAATIALEGGSGGGATWGSIGGTLSNQVDLSTALAGKVDVETGKGLSTNDYTTAEQTKLSGIEDGAQVNAPNTVIDASYVHTDNNYTTAEKTKLAGLENYDDTNVLSSISDLSSGKVDKVAGKGLSTEDYTTADKNKLANLNHETWTFTLSDNTTVTKEVVIWGV